MKKFIVTLLLALGGLYGVSGQSEKAAANRKYDRLKRSADHLFQKFSYLKASEKYKAAFELYRNGDLEVQLATCYLRLNQPREAAFWYKMAEADGAILTKEDWINYGMALQGIQQYEQAREVFSKYAEDEPWLIKRVEALSSIEGYYKDQYAYEVTWESFNSTAKDFSPTFRNNELVFVSSRDNHAMKKNYNWDGSNFLELYELKHDRYAEKLSDAINTKYHEGPAAFFDHGNQVFFTRNSFLGNRVKLTEEKINNLRLFHSHRETGGKWSHPTEFKFNSKEYSLGHPAVSSDGKTLYFASDMPGGMGGVDLYRSTFEEGKWGAPENLGSEINTPKDELFPYIHKDQVLYFASNGHPGLGGLDQFWVDVSPKEEVVVHNLGYPVNTHADDFGLSFRPESNQAYFSSNRPGGMGDDDIYSVRMNDYAVEVILIDHDSRKPITTSGRMDVIKTLRSQMNENGISIAKTRINFGVERGTSFLVTGSADGYYPGNLIIQIVKENIQGIRHLKYEIPLKRMEFDRQAEILVVLNNDKATQLFFTIEGEKNSFEGSLESLRSKIYEMGYEVVKETYLTNIFYDFDRYDIRPDAAKNLDQLIVYMQSEPSMSVILEAHTDERGSNQYNKSLSKRRVDAASEYLKSGGIQQDRIFTGSHGEEQTFVDCQEGCDEQDHASNRRTEIRIELNKPEGSRSLTTASLPE